MDANNPRNLINENVDEIEAINIIIQQTLLAIKKNNGLLKLDRTYRSVIKAITPKGYVILDDSGAERTVKCCIPGIELKVGQNVWVKEPEGNLNWIHICGVV